MLSSWWSPKQERSNKEAKNIEEFLTEYFNQRFTGEIVDDYDLQDIRIEAVLTPNETSSPPNDYETKTKEIITYLFNNFRNKLNANLIKPDSNLKQFILVESLDFSNRSLKLEEIKLLSDCLRSSTTIETVKLEYCGLTNESIKYLTSIFWSNKKINSLSLIDNDAITDISIRNLLKVKENNNILRELKITIPTTNNNTGFYCIRDKENIFDENFKNNRLAETEKRNTEIVIKNKNLEPRENIRNSLKEMHKNADKLLKLLAKSYNEIIGKGILDKVLILLGMGEFGKTVLGYQLSDSTASKKFEVTASNTLKSVYKDYDKKIRHNKKIQMIWTIHTSWLIIFYMIKKM